MITKEEIIETKDWYGTNENTFIWAHKNVNDFSFEMQMYENNFFIISEFTEFNDLILFRGYIKSINDLQDVIRLCNLRQKEQSVIDYLIELNINKDK